MTEDKIVGALMGTAVGDALGMPVEGFSHQNVRMFYKGIKGYQDDEKRGDLKGGQWTDDTQLTFVLVRALTDSPGQASVAEGVAQEYLGLLPEARRWGPTTRAAVERLAGGTAWTDSGKGAGATNGAAMRAAPLGAWWAARRASWEEAAAFIMPVLSVTHRHPVSLAAGLGQAFAVRYALLHTPESFAAAEFWREVAAFTSWAEGRVGAGGSPLSERLALLGEHLSDFPLDLQDLCNGTGTAAEDSWPFVVAMFARNPLLLEATLLSAVNVGGDADTVGAMTGALLGALHGWSAFPEAWRTGLEDVQRLEGEARRMAGVLESIRR